MSFRQNVFRQSVFRQSVFRQNVRPPVALSSAEAEYQAMAAAVQEAIYLRALLEDFGLPMKKPIDIVTINPVSKCVTTL